MRRFIPRARMWLIQTLGKEKANDAKWTLKMVVLCGNVAFIHHKMWLARTKPFPLLAEMRTPIWLHFTTVHKSVESGMVAMTTVLLGFVSRTTSELYLGSPLSYCSAHSLNVRLEVNRTRVSFHPLLFTPLLMWFTRLGDISEGASRS